MSPHPYNVAFEEDTNLVYFERFSKPTGGMKFTVQGECLILEHMVKSSPGARITKWRTRLKKAWLISINVNGINMKTINDVR